MSNDIPEGFRDCWMLSLSLHGCRWLSHDGVLTVNVTERITRTAREFVSKELRRLGRTILPMMRCCCAPKDNQCRRYRRCHSG